MQRKIRVGMLWKKSEDRTRCMAWGSGMETGGSAQRKTFKPALKKDRMGSM